MGQIKRKNKTMKSLPVGEGTNISLTVNGVLVPMVRVTVAAVNEEGAGVLLQIEELYYDSKE